MERRRASSVRRRPRSRRPAGDATDLAVAGVDGEPAAMSSSTPSPRRRRGARSPEQAECGEPGAGVDAELGHAPGDRPPQVDAGVGADARWMTRTGCRGTYGDGGGLLARQRGIDAAGQGHRRSSSRGRARAQQSGTSAANTSLLVRPEVRTVTVTGARRATVAVTASVNGSAHWASSSHSVRPPGHSSRRSAAAARVAGQVGGGRPAQRETGHGPQRVERDGLEQAVPTSPAVPGPMSSSRCPPRPARRCMPADTDATRQQMELLGRVRPTRRRADRGRVARSCSRPRRTTLLSGPHPGIPPLPPPPPISSPRPTPLRTTGPPPAWRSSSLGRCRSMTSASPRRQLVPRTSWRPPSGGWRESGMGTVTARSYRETPPAPAVRGD